MQNDDVILLLHYSDLRQRPVTFNSCFRNTISKQEAKLSLG